MQKLAGMAFNVVVGVVRGRVGAYRRSVKTPSSPDHDHISRQDWALGQLG